MRFGYPEMFPSPCDQKSRTELDRMERIGVISRVDKPTDWCAGMVVVPKAVRICVDLKPLNSSVLREPHPIPTVDDTLALLSSVNWMPIVDFGRCHWQRSLVI